MNGVVVVDKPINYTSRDVVNIIGKIFKTKKVGHTGTLDPMATGVLIVCIGNATKIVELLTNYDKEYIATFKFGVLTDTLDSLGNIIEDHDNNISKEEITSALNKITGTYMQEVPIYSAVKINGRKLYEYAREGIDVELPKHEVTISSLELLSHEIIDNHTVIKVKCNVSKGTYIRSLGNDIASLLNTHAIMTELRRTKQGSFTIDDAIKLDDIKETTNLLSITDCLHSYEKAVASKEIQNDIVDGKILDNVYTEDKVLFIDENNNALALYEVYDKDNNKIKPWKMFIHR